MPLFTAAGEGLVLKMSKISSYFGTGALLHASGLAEWIQANSEDGCAFSSGHSDGDGSGRQWAFSKWKLAQWKCQYRHQVLVATAFGYYPNSLEYLHGNMASSDGIVAERDRQELLERARVHWRFNSIRFRIGGTEELTEQSSVESKS